MNDYIGFKPLMSNVKLLHLEFIIALVLSFKPLMSNVKLHKYVICISLKNKKINKKDKNIKSTSISKYKIHKIR